MTVLDLFSSQVQEKAHKLALKFRDIELTYQELDDISDQLATHLIAKGIRRGTLVPICMQSPLNMVIGIWGILKAGGVYVPIDAEFPVERISYMIRDTAAQVVISDTSCGQFLAAIQGETVVFADDDWAIIRNEPGELTGVAISGEDLAYVIYTSGSTGLPKGVLIKHKSIVDYLDGLFDRLPYKECRSFALGVSFAADSVITHLFGSAALGAELHLFSKEDYNNVEYIHAYFAQNNIDCLKVVPSHWKALSLNGTELLPQKILMFGGEALYTATIRDIIPASKRSCILVNHYGPTETTVGQLLHVINDSHPYGNTIPIGQPFTDATAYILNEEGMEVAGEDAGELFIGGTCVAAGYLNRPELTSERFVKNPFSSDIDARLYRTGDLVSRLPGGDIEFLGRIDDQVKIRGHRIELGEIEHALQSAPGVHQGVVLAKEGSNGDKRLVAYVVCPAGYDRKAIIDFLEEKLPDYMVPRLLVPLAELLFLPNGKVNRKALPNPDASTLLANVYSAPVGKTENFISAIWKEVLGVERAGRDDNFFELGGTSLLALRTVALLKLRHSLSLPVVKLYRYPRIKDLAAFLDGKAESGEIKTGPEEARADVAIIGMSGRFPGADSIDEFLDLLKNGRETTTFFADNQLDVHLSPATRNNRDYVKARGIISDVKGFDAAFFGISPKHAELMDPQQRIFLEIAWEALEQAGYVSGQCDGKIGVFAGVRFNTYYANNVVCHPDLVEKVGSLQAITLNDKDYVASRVAYVLDLKGPAVNVQSACSTSLVAVAQAVQSIRSGQCDMALAGGAAINSPVNVGHLYEEGAMLSNDGHCRPFDKEAKGTLFSDGAGVVLLKSKEAAIRDGDTIFAIIKGVGLSNDGGQKGSFTAPSAEGQATAIRMAMADAGVDPADIGYVETHGTATPLGDPIEIEGLNMAFGETAQKQCCAIGSVKGNFGHLTAAAGVTGLIKTCLSLYHKQIFPSINFSEPNPQIDFANSPFYVNTELNSWNTNKERVAGVSSFGIGGTNAHIILSEAAAAGVQPTTRSRPAQFLCWSAKSNESLDRYGDKLANFITKMDADSMADFAYTLQTARKDFGCRRFIVAKDKNDLLEQLANFAHSNSNTKNLRKKPQGVVFMFPGQGDQYVNMSRSLYETEPVFRRSMEECAEILKEELNENILDVIYPSEINETTVERIKYTRYSQPALFTLGYALGNLWMNWGIFPSAFVGHSVGEFVAAYFAGIFSLKDALKLIAARCKMMGELPRGGMLSVRMSHADIQQYLSDTIELAAVNSPQLCVVAGNAEAIAALSDTLDVKEIPNKLLPTSHAFHSYMMDPVVAPFEEIVKSVRLSEPSVPIASSVTGRWLTKEEALDAGYWARHLRAPVLFSQTVGKLIDESYDLFLELGPGRSMAALARQHAKDRTISVISSFEREEAVLPSEQAILQALGQLWLNGIEPDWASFYKDEKRQKRYDVPGYAFHKQDYWLEVVSRNIPASSSVSITEDPIEDASGPGPVSGKQQLINKIGVMLESISGFDMETIKSAATLVEMGFDSLLLTQVALALRKQFAIPITFRQLNEELGSIELIANYLDPMLSPDKMPRQKNETLSKAVARPAELTPQEEIEIKRPFGAIARIERQSAVLDDVQKRYLEALIVRYNQKTSASKAFTQEHRAHMADPRVVSGFKPVTKELAYPIVIKRSKGSRLWDLDGNEYIDALNGFGSNLLGYQPEFLKQALIDQIEKGYEIGPQHELAGEVCKLICEFTGFDRAALCNTGSEAVLGAMRIARTITGRSLIVAFAGSYHGITDEVIARGSKNLRTYPAAPGIMPEAVQNMLILEYGTDESLKIIEERAGEIAAVLVEPVQSRRCDFQPIAFLKKLRRITRESNTVLIFDEVISGFRFHPGGVQAMFGIKADVATYGKVVGGGMSIGIIAGKKNYMDALDGGWWQFGDDSVPEAGVTYFAGTFVRHPLALATALASLQHFKMAGPALQEQLNTKGQYVADAINSICRNFRVPIHIAQFGSLWRIRFLEDYPHSELFFVLMRYKGVHVIEGFPCFITAAHTDADLKHIIRCFEESLIELKQVNLLPDYEHPVPGKNKMLNIPPVPFAKLGKDKEGNPAWFINDENNPGKYLQVIN